MIDVDAALKRHLDTWLHLLDLDRAWVVTYAVTDGPITSDKAVALNVYFKRKSGKSESHITFDRTKIKNDREAEEAALHEVLHLCDWGIGNDAHKLIERLERKLVTTRKRAGAIGRRSG